MALYETFVLRTSLSAINLENQGFAKLVHGFVHESPIFGAFFMSISKCNTNNKRSPAITELQHCTRCNSGLRNNVCCKFTHNQGFFKIPARIFLIQLTIGVRFR